MRHLLPALALLLPGTLQAAEPPTISGKVVAIADGDTLTVLDAAKTEHKVRLHGIDTPEKKQAYGTKAREALADLVYKKEVVVTVVDTDRYKRTVGKVTVGEVDVNTKMVRDGWAWRYTTYDKRGEYREPEAEARKAKRGLWADPNPTPPWEFRRKK